MFIQYQFQKSLLKMYFFFHNRSFCDYMLDVYNPLEAVLLTVILLSKFLKNYLNF